MAITASAPVPILFHDQFGQRHNTAWRIEPAMWDPPEPILDTSTPWESGSCNGHGTALIDPIDGRWKMWYLGNEAMGQEFRLCYAESDDGRSWRRPALDLCPYDGQHPRTNVLIDRSWGCNCHDASVIVDPAAPEDRRYEMFILLSGIRGRPFVLPGLPLPPDQRQHRSGVYRLVSSDGLRWRPVRGGLFETADSVYVFPDPGRGYVAYHKSELPSFPATLIPFDIGRGGCRVINRRTSHDGEVWSPPVVVLTPDWRDPQDTQFMEIHPHAAAGGTLGFVTVYHALNGTIDLQFAASRDGLRWWRPDRRACVGLRPLGDGASAQLWPMHHAVEHAGRLYLFFAGLDTIHHDLFDTAPGERIAASGLPYREWRLAGEAYNPFPSSPPDHGPMYRVSWEVGRYWAAVPAAGGPSEAVLTTTPADLAGRRVELNATVLSGGSLTAELQDAEGSTLPGFAADDCDRLAGDHRRAVLSWAGRDAAPEGARSIRFRLRRARLYGFEVSQAAGP